ncbi:MAG: hypothetical protein HY919_02960 [Elusimicrobia bacterium]|nr:hypothetical protein [Elusimicrobiota bacterium]
MSTESLPFALQIAQKGLSATKSLSEKIQGGIKNVFPAIPAVGESIQQQSLTPLKKYGKTLIPDFTDKNAPPLLNTEQGQPLFNPERIKYDNRKTAEIAFKMGQAIALSKPVPVGGSLEQMKYLTKILGKEEATKMAAENPKLAESIFKLKDIQKIVPSVPLASIPSKQVPQVFKGEKLNLPPEQIDIIKSKLDILGFKMRDVKTFSDMEDAAQILGLNPSQLLKTVPSDLTPEGNVALKNLINARSQYIINAQKEIAQNPEAEQLLFSKINVANQQIDDALKIILPGNTEGGRLVASNRIFARDSLDPAFWLSHAQKMLGDNPLTPEGQNAILDLISKSDGAGLAQFVAGLKQSSNLDKMITLWKAGLLTSPTTHLANIGGNITMAGLETAKDIPATFIDKIYSVFSGKRTTTVSPNTILEKVKGGISGLTDAASYLKTGFYTDDIMAKYDIPYQVNFDNKILDIYTKGVFRMLGAEDIIFRKMALSESLAKQAEVEAINQGLKGQAAKDLIKELLLNPTNKMIVNAIDVAEYATFQNPNVLADIINKIKYVGEGKRGGSAVRLGTEITVPFVRTPSNIVARVFDYTPSGFVKAIYHALKIPETQKQAIIVNDLGRAITGSTVIGLGYLAAKAGIMIGNLPSNTQEKNQAFAEGKQSNSIKFLGAWRKLDRFSPMGVLLTMGADLALSESKDSAITKAGFGALKTVKEMPMLRGISGIGKAVDQPETFGQKFVNQTIGSLVPTIVAKIAKIFDPNLRRSENLIQTIAAKIPILSKTVPVYRDIWGEPVRGGGGRLAIIDPFVSKTAINDPIINEAKRVGEAIGMPSQIISGIKLTNGEYDIYQNYQGKALKETLKNLINSEEYKQSSITEQADLFSSAEREVRNQINDIIFPALMIRKYSLPKNIDTALLRDALLQFSKNDKFKNASQDQQRKYLLDLFKSY